MIGNMSSERRSDGEQTHNTILDQAVQLASIEGLGALTLGRLADLAGMSKSGLYAHFGSKERLQIEVVEAARRIFEREVIEPAFAAPEGLPRFTAACEAYLSYLERGVFPGGCFFYTLIAEFDAQPGRFREEVISDRREWEELLSHQIRVAQKDGDIDPSIEPRQLVFEAEAAMELTNVVYNLERDPAVIKRGRNTVRAAIERARAGNRS